MKKRPEWELLTDIDIDPEFGHFTKVARTRALKALMYAGKLDRVDCFLHAWRDSKAVMTESSNRANPMADDYIAYYLVCCYPRGYSNPYEGDKVFAYIAALYHTLQKRNPALVAKYMRHVDQPMKMFQVAYALNNETGGLKYMSEVYYGFRSVFDVMHALLDKYGFYPLVLNVYCETLPDDIADTLRYLYGSKRECYSAKEWYENYDKAKKYLESQTKQQ